LPLQYNLAAKARDFCIAVCDSYFKNMVSAQRCLEPIRSEG